MDTLKTTKDTIQEMAIKLVTEQNNLENQNFGNKAKESTIFIMGGKGVVSMHFLIT